jgi:hypothetical protein
MEVFAIWRALTRLARSLASCFTVLRETLRTSSSSCFISRLLMSFLFRFLSDRVIAFPLVILHTAFRSDDDFVTRRLHSPHSKLLSSSSLVSFSSVHLVDRTACH